MHKLISLCIVLVAFSITDINGFMRAPHFKGVPRSFFFDDQGPTADSLVTIKNGTLMGKSTIGGGRVMYVYQGIPYAKAPVGELRFKAPQTYDGWGDEIRDATVFPPSCPQHDPALQASSEDCLFLNVYSSQPSNVSTADLPVMVFIHGGGFSSGESTYYTGAKLLVNGGVVVVLHYRLGPLGFLSTNDEVSPGNYGLKDVVQALHWVQENIGAFGGNKDDVTIFGESAGGAAVIYSLISPLTRGLFSKAISQSGSAISQWALDRNPFEGAQKLATLLNCPNDTSVNIVNCLRELPWENITETAYQSGEDAYANLNLGLEFTTPTIEPDLPGAFITQDPMLLLEQGEIADVPLILGSTLHEGSYVLGLLYEAKIGPGNLTDDADWMREEIIPGLLKAFGLEDDLGGGAIEETVALAYMPGMSRENWTEIMPSLVDMMSVFFMKSSVMKTANILSKRLSNVYLYSLEEYSENSMWTWLFLGSDAPPITPGITHADDLMYLFNMPIFPRPDDIAFSKILSEMWSNFAHYGDPTPTATEEYPKWPKYDIRNKQFMRLNVTSSISTDFTSTWRPQGFVA